MAEPGRVPPPLPPHLLEQARAGRAELEGERKVVTLLFADVVGSTALASRLDPEDLRDLLNGLFAHWVAAVHRYEGTVDKFLGDGMLALFGAPLVHEDDARRAVLAALEIRDATRTYAASAAPALDVRVGLNTGTVVVGAVGSDARMEYTAIGDAVNVAQRVESAARPGAVFIADATRRLAGPHVLVREAGSFPLKGKDEPAVLYEVTGVADLRGSGRGVEGLTSPMVGRHHQLDELRRRLTALAAGAGSVVALVGEPGLGKSRLLAELRREAAGITWAEGHALSYGATTPYLPVAGLVADLDPAPADPDLAALIAGATSADGAHDRIVAAVRRLVVERAPLVVAVEDLHWADQATLDVLGVLAETTRSHPLLLIVTTRPEGAPRAAALAAEPLPIEPLDPAHHLELLANLLRLDRIPAALRDLVVERSQGNPFFTEEFLRMLIDGGVLERSEGTWLATATLDRLTVPPTLQGLVASRIDRLDPAAKALLQAASVIGPVVDEALLARLVDGPLDPAPLHDGGFLLPGPEPGSHVFKHVITQEVAYEGILKKARRALHRRAADGIEALAPEETGLRAAELGRHLDLAGEAARAVPYLTLAAERSFAAFSNEAALELAGRALELTDEPAMRFDLLELRTRVLGHLGRHDEEWEAVESLQALAGDDPPRRLRALEAAINSRLGSSYVDAYPLGREALELSERVGDALSRGRVLMLWAELMRRQYSPVRAIPALEEAVELFTRLGERRRRAAALSELAGVKAIVDPARHPDAVEAALAAAREAGDPQLLAVALLRSGLHRVLQADSAGALAALDQAAAIAGEIGDTSLQVRCLRMAGFAHVLSGDIAAADRHFLASLELAHRLGDAHAWLSGALALVEEWECQERIGDLHRWLSAMDAEVEGWGQAHNAAYIQYALGYRVMRWLNRPAEVAARLERAVASLDEAADWKPPEVMYRNGRATMLVELGRLDEARRLLDAARAAAARHQLEEVTLAYLLVTEARLGLAAGETAAAREAIERLSERAAASGEVGERHAAEFLAAQAAWAEGRPPEAAERAQAALDVEPLRATTRWFSRLAVLDLLARATEAAGGDAGPIWTEARRAVGAFLPTVPEDYLADVRERPDIASILRATGG